jgi:membrane-associated protease RseP (regulator of RpoE activity)
MNMVLAIVCFSAIYSVSGIPEEVNYVVIDGIAPKSPAESAGLGIGDRILSVDGTQMSKVSEFVGYLKLKGGKQFIPHKINNN